MGMGKKNASRLRQKLRVSSGHYQGQLELALKEQGPLIRGSFGTRERVCGNPRCKCARGELHESKYLTATDKGRVRQVHVPAADEEKVAAGVERYRRFREVRGRVAKLAQEQLELMDQLGRSLLMAYPPDNPLPPAQHSGPPPREGRRGRR
jgi:hypothetical protein